MNNMVENMKENELLEQFSNEALYCSKLGGYYYIRIPGRSKALTDRDTRELYKKWKKEINK